MMKMKKSTSKKAVAPAGMEKGKQSARPRTVALKTSRKADEPDAPKPPHRKKRPGERDSIKRIPAFTRKQKIYDQEEKLWIARLNTILADGYIRQLLIDLAGENTLEIVRNFKGEVSDEELAKRLKLKISDVRATLNKLHNESLVYYVRQKDNETGWYSYSWLLNKTKVQEWASGHIQKRNSFDMEGNDRYFCPSCGLESLLEFERATECEFRCQKCNKGLEYLDQEKFIELTRM